MDLCCKRQSLINHSWGQVALKYLPINQFVIFAFKENRIIFVTICLPRFPSDQRAQGKLLFLYQHE
jgi:hypothetical protein